MHVLASNPPREPPRPYEFEFLEGRRETPTVSTYWFSTVGSGFHYRATQAVRLVLPDSGDPRPWRLFSLSSSPTETGRIAVTMKMTGSAFKERLRRMRPGERVTGIGPFGDLFYDPGRAAVFLAGGIGVTPFRGMMRYAVDTGVSLPIVLLYSARTPDEFAFREEFDRFVDGRSQFRVWYSVTRAEESGVPWNGRTGRIDETWVRTALDGLDRPKVYVAGLPRMAHETVAMLKAQLGFSEEDLEYEYYMGY